MTKQTSTRRGPGISRRTAMATTAAAAAAVVASAVRREMRGRRPVVVCLVIGSYLPFG